MGAVAAQCGRGTRFMWLYSLVIEASASSPVLSPNELLPSGESSSSSFCKSFQMSQIKSFDPQTPVSSARCHAELPWDVMGHGCHHHHGMSWDMGATTHVPHAVVTC